MSPTDLPPVITPHSAEIIGSNFPVTSETGTVASVITLFEQAAASVGTGNTAEVMFGLIEANATGQTPTKLLEGFNEDQRAAFDRALRELNMGQGASVMAQDILNTKVQLNGTVVEFESAVEQLIASYAASGGPSSPQNQAEFQQRYQELLDQAKSRAEKLGSNHKSTQESLLAGVQKGTAPQIPSTMAPTSSSNPTVPGMPDGALGSMLQNVAGQMMKPQNMQMPKLDQAMQPLTQSAQSAIGELMKRIPGESGVPITEDALTRLAKSSGIGDSGSTLSGPRAAGGAPGSESPAGGAGGAPRAPLSASNPENSRSGPAIPAADTEADAPAVETPAGVPTEPAVTEAPSPSSAPATTLSSGDAAGGSDPLSSPRVHTSAGDAGGSGAAPLSQATGSPGASPNTTASGGAAHVGGGMAPMMAPMMGGAGAGSGGSSGPPKGGGLDPLGGSAKPVKFRPLGHETPAELLDFGSDLKGLEHATDMQMVAASIAAALVRMHDRLGRTTQVAVGVSPTEAVFVTSDGLGFLPPGVRAAGHLTPLIKLVPDAFLNEWLGCDQPWRPLLKSAGLGLAGPFNAVVSTDPDAASRGVLVLGPDEIAAVNIAAGSADRWEFDAVDTADIEDAVELLRVVWGQPSEQGKPGRSPAELEDLARLARWSGSAGPGDYPARWARYLLAAAVNDLAGGHFDDARYALRCALRVPEPAAVGARR